MAKSADAHGGIGCLLRCVQYTLTGITEVFPKELDPAWIQEALRLGAL